MTMNQDRQRVALVIGGAGGIGAAVVSELASTCARIIVLDRGAVSHRALESACEERGARYMGLDANIADESSVNQAFAEIGKGERLDIVVNSAGIAPTAGQLCTTEEMSLSDWQTVIDVNLTGTFLTCRAAIPLLKRNGWGRIVTMSSQTARLASAYVGAHYSASKLGIVALTRVLALELAESNITVNCVAPGLTATRMASGFDVDAYAKSVPLGRLGQPEDIAKAVGFLASDAAQYITGVTLDVNGGKFMA